MIRVLIYRGEDESHQLGEVRFERLTEVGPDGAAQYQAQIAVDTGPDFHFFDRSILHWTDRDNVLGLLSALVDELTLDECMMTGKPRKPESKRSPWKQLGSMWK